MKKKAKREDYPKVEEFLNTPLEMGQSECPETRERMTKSALLISVMAEDLGEKEIFYTCAMRVCHNLTISCFEHKDDIDEVKDEMHNFMEECFTSHWERVCKFTEENMIEPVKPAKQYTEEDIGNWKWVNEGLDNARKPEEVL